MPGHADIAATAALLADPGRARMLSALGDGRVTERGRSALGLEAV